MINYRKIIVTVRINLRSNNYRNLCTAVMYNMAAMQRENNKTECQLKPTYQQRSRRSCDKSRGDKLVSSATPRCTYSLTAAMLYITAVKRLR